MKKEIELLKKEIELLKLEIELLKEQLKHKDIQYIPYPYPAPPFQPYLPQPWEVTCTDSSITIDFENHHLGDIQYTGGTN